MDIIGALLKHLYITVSGATDESAVFFPCTIYDKPFHLSDEGACNSCQRDRSISANCNRHNLSVNISNPVAVLDLDSFMHSLARFSKEYNEECCDYLIYDDGEERRRIAFCELSCIEEKYLAPNDKKNNKGKRAKAYSQIKNALETFLRIDVLNTAILTFSSKIGIFGWRDSLSSLSAEDDRAITNMRDFSITPSYEEPILYLAPFDLHHDFVFIQVKYPSSFPWDIINTYNE